MYGTFPKFQYFPIVRKIAESPPVGAGKTGDVAIEQIVTKRNEKLAINMQSTRLHCSYLSF